MLYLHDIWINWFEEENLNLVPYFHEWRKDDSAELLDQVPILIVNENLFNYIAFGKNIINDDIKKSIYRKSYYRKNHERVEADYCFICTDKNRFLVVELDSEGNVFKKSRLIPRQFQVAHEMVVSDNYKAHFELHEEVDLSDYEKYIGLTRSEKESLKTSLEFINELPSNKMSLLTYLVSEWCVSLYQKLNNLGFEAIKEKLISELTKSNIERLVHFNKVIGKVKQIN